MGANRFACVGLLTAGLALLGPGTGSAADAVIGHDAVFSARALETRPITRIAVLPPVCVEDNVAAERAVERGLSDFGFGTHVSWILPTETDARLGAAPSGGGELCRVVRAEIWRNGAVTPETAVRAAHALDVDAVLSVRIERWELVDGGRGTVEMMATLHGADGARLWSISGNAAHGRGLTSSEAVVRLDEPQALWDARLNPPRNGRIGVAFYAMLRRWSGELPRQFFEDRAATPLLAEHSAEGAAAR